MDVYPFEGVCVCVFAQIIVVVRRAVDFVIDARDRCSDRLWFDEFADCLEKTGDRTPATRAEAG